MKKEKFASESLTTMTEMIFPNDTNNLGNLMGGNLLRLMDICGAIAAQKHANSIVVTASVDNVAFKEPVPLGTVVTLRGGVTRSFNSSMEVYIEVFAEDIPASKKVMTNHAFFTFVAVDAQSRPHAAPAVVPQSERETELYEGALRRRELRLVLSGRMKPAEATSLAGIFEEKNG